VESLAGIMGGDATAVSDDTKNVYVEAAFWWPEAVAGRSRRFNFSTDAGHRFERGVDPSLTVEHIEHITALIQQICGGEAGPIDDQTLALPERKAVTLRVARAAKVLGMPLSTAQCAQVFQRLGLAFEQQGDTLVVTPPAWRFDLAIEEDLIEEVIRVIGLQHLPTTPPHAPVTSRPQREGRVSPYALRRSLASLGYHETITFSFVEERTEIELAGNPDPIRVLNPIAAPLAVMRSSLLGSLIGVLKTNLARKASRVRVFEVGRVFRRDASVQDGPLAVAGVDQPMRVAGLAWGAADELQWGERERAVDFFDVKGDLQALLVGQALSFHADVHPAMHPGRCARVELGGRVLGHVGELHPKWRQSYDLPSAPVLFELVLDGVLARQLPAFEPLPRQQAAMRDLALVVRDHVSHEALVSALSADPAGLVRQATLFDIYKPAQAQTGMAADERSLAVRLELLDDAATLTDERIEQAVAAAVQRAAQACGARLRA
jgi:phenylalanyl-tRNA synthetase beta chain